MARGSFRNLPLSEHDCQNFVPEVHFEEAGLSLKGLTLKSINRRLIVTVRRQGFWHQELRKLRECPAHLVGFIMRRAVCDASVALRVSFV